MSARLEESVAEILVIDDMSTDMLALSEALSGDGYAVRRVCGTEAAMRGLDAARPDLILLGSNAQDAFDFCGNLKAVAEFARIPVIFLSAQDETHKKITAFEVGCVDYIVKPFAVDEILARVRFHLKQKHERDVLGFRAGHDVLTGLPNRSLLIDLLQQAVSYAERY